MSNELVKYQAACNAIAAAKNVDEVKNIRDKSAAIQAYARQAKNKQLEIDAAEIRIRAERRLGEMIREQKETVGLQAGARGIGKPKSGVPERYPTTPTLADVGIDKKLSSRAQKIAAVPEQEFEGMMGDWREEVAQVGERVTTNIIKKGEEKQRTTPHVAFATGENEWYTPPKYVAAARRVMGGIDCDPASSEKANETVGADVFFTQKDNGLLQKWNGRVWCNPPYAQPLVSRFSDAIVEKFKSGEIDEACILVNNATETVWFQTMAECSSAICFPRGRIRFLGQDGDKGAPLQGQAVIYLGEKSDAFCSVFETFGITWKK